MLTKLPACGVMKGSDIKDRVDSLIDSETLYAGIKELPQIDGVTLNVKGFYVGSDVGGGQFYYDSSRSKADHNGGTVIAPEAIAAWDGTSGDIATLLDWSGAGVGCFTKAAKQVVYDVEFGFVSGDATTILNKIAISTEVKEIVFSSDFSVSGTVNMSGKSISSTSGKVVSTGDLRNVILNGVYKRSKPNFVSLKTPALPSASSDMKMLIRRTDKAAYVMQQNNQGYIRTVIKDNNFTTVDSAGAPAELIRATAVDSYHEVWVGHGVATDVVAATTTTETFGGSVYQRLSKYGQASSDSFDKGAGLSKYFLSTNGQYVEYESVEVVDGFINLMIQASSTTTFPNGFAVTVDGIAVNLQGAATQSPSGDAGLLIYQIPAEFSERSTANTRTLKVTHSGSTGVDKANIVGCNMFTLSQLSKPLKNINWYAAFSLSAPYIATTGATDYAIYDSDDSQWVGSYHGGETRTSYKLEVNGRNWDYEGAAFESYVMGTQIRMQQSTNITSKLDTYQYIDWSHFGGYTLQVSMKGNINCTDFFTCMSTSHPNFNFIEYPVFNSTETAGQYDVGNNDNVVIQCETVVPGVISGRKISNEFTFFKTGDSDFNGAYVASSTFYNKLYYGPVFDGQANIESIGFITVKKFY